MTDPAQQLIGRDVEVERLNALVNRLHEGGGALVISGEAGIGKSALLGHVREQAQSVGSTVLETAGAESEAELGFAGLHQLLSLTRKKKLGVVKELTEIVVAAGDPELAARAWVLIVESPDGGWGIAGLARQALASKLLRAG